MHTFDEIEAIERLPIGPDIFWSNDSIKVDEAAFDALYGRLEQLEAQGRIAIIEEGRESYTGQRLVIRVKFTRLA